MARLQKAHSGSTKSAVSREAEEQQSGRSSSSLSADCAAASLRESESQSTDESTPDTHHVGQSVIAAASGTLPAPPIVSSLPPSRRPSYAPPVPSPLNPNVTPDPIDPQSRSSDESRSSSSRLQVPSRKTSYGNHPSPAKPKRLQKRLLKQKHIEKTENDTPRLATPLVISDLGSDYTRYFNPFSDSHRNSTGGTTAQLSQNQHSSQANLPSVPTNPFNTPQASTTNLNRDTDVEMGVGLIDDRLGAPYDEKSGLGWPMADDGPEDDDDLHMPSSSDDAKFKPRLKECLRPENIRNIIGTIVLVLGLTCVIVVLPILSYTGHISSPSSSGGPVWSPYAPPETWATVNNRTYPLLKNIRTGLIDPATPKSALTKQGIRGDDLILVFSDEFNQNNRTFYEGDDPYWYAPDIWYGATKDLEWYDPDAVTTWDGVLELRLDNFINHGLNYRSGMLNSWNHLCFKGGVFEVSVSLPGPAAVMGLWPGAWTMGNLGRPGYLSTTDGLWPYTYNSCDAGITPNQSSSDGLSYLPGQRLPSCTCPGEDHPTPGRGRGAPEIDIFEAGASYPPVGLPIATQSYQAAPFDIWYYPNYNYTMFPDYSISYPNGYTGGPYQQAISATTNLNRDWYDGKAYQKYHFEYVPGEGKDAYIAWFVGDQLTFKMDGRAIGPNGNIAARQISEEPMSMVLNLGFSTSWTFIDYEKLVFPTVMRVDYVRIYQKKDSVSITCDPPGYETTQYIKDHLNAYTNPNFTKWAEAGHAWPQHKLNSDC